MTTKFLSGPSRRTALGVLFATCVSRVFAQDRYPSRPVSLTVSNPPGGTTDALARTVAAGLAKQLGQSVVIENRPGAGTAIGAVQVARSAKDGHTLLLASTSAFATNPHVYSNLPYKVSDFEPISLIATAPWILAVTPSLPAKNLQEVVAYAKQRPGELNYYSPGPGTTAHLFVEMMQREAGFKATAIGYKGEGPALLALLAGQIHLMPSVINSNMIEQHKAGKLRIVAIADNARSPAAPDVPTFAEAGIPGVLASSWFGIASPAGVPAPILDRLQQALQKTMEDPEVRTRVLAGGLQPRSSTRQEFSELIRRESAAWGELVRQLGIKLSL